MAECAFGFDNPCRLTADWMMTLFAGWTGCLAGVTRRLFSIWGLGEIQGGPQKYGIVHSTRREDEAIWRERNAENEVLVAFQCLHQCSTRNLP